MAVSLINSLTEPFRPEHYTDERRQDMLELIEEKITGREGIAPETPEQEPPMDLLAALEASLREASQGMGEGVRH